jgi:hypothetical protein
VVCHRPQPCESPSRLQFAHWGHCQGDRSSMEPVFRTRLQTHKGVGVRKMALKLVCPTPKPVVFVANNGGSSTRNNIWERADHRSWTLRSLLSWVSESVSPHFRAVLHALFCVIFILLFGRLRSHWQSAPLHWRVNNWRPGRMDSAVDPTSVPTCVTAVRTQAMGQAPKMLPKSYRIPLLETFVPQVSKDAAEAAFT